MGQQITSVVCKFEVRYEERLDFFYLKYTKQSMCYSVDNKKIEFCEEKKQFEKMRYSAC